MVHLRALAPWLAFLTLIGTSACGDDSAPPGAGDGPEEEDAGLPPDEEDADVEEDGGSDAAAGDGGGESDGETLDQDGGDADGGLVDAGDVSECEGDLLEFEAARSAGRPLTAGISGNMVQLVYVVPAGGGTSGNNSAQGLRYVPFGTTGDAGAAVDVVNVGIDSYFRTRDPSLVVREGAVDLFYTSNSEGPYELFYKDLAQSVAPARETNNTMARNEFAVAASAFGDGAGVVYSSDPAALNMPGGLNFKQPGKAAVELVAESAGYHVGQVAFSEVGDLGSGHAVAIFLSDLSSKAGIFAQPVGASGAPDGALVTLSTALGGASSVDVTRGKEGGALIYTEAPAGSVHQLRFRQIAADGTVSGTVRNLTSGNQDLRDVSIAAYSHGYVIAYRRVGGLPNTAASIYLLFVDAQGNRSGTRLVHSSTLSGGGLKVLVANDGRFVVLWADTESVTNMTTNKTEIALKVRAARLNCAP